MISVAGTIKERMLGMYGENKVLPAIPDGAPFAICENGTFIGTRTEGVVCFKGIPFAKPPIGPLRWKAPEEAEPKEEIREAFYNGKTPIQTQWESEVASYYPQGEDCLYLNLWQSESGPKEKKPVMVFFHGGSYGWGGTADPLYDGFHFVKEQEDIILVTAGYRTGIMGFVDLSSLPGGEDYPDAPNLGLLDQIEALRWVQKNVASFGGDPENVTIFGESAGGGSVSLLPILPQAKGLFRRVIAESGSVALTFSKKDCEEFTRRLVKETGCHSVEELCALTEEELKAVNEKLNYYNNFPQRDGRLIPLDPYEPYQKGETAAIDMIIGTNQNESNYWIGELGGIIPYALSAPVKFENDVRSLPKADQKRVAQFMKETLPRYKHKIWCRGEFYNEMMFRLPAICQAEGHSRNGGRVYVYYWTEPSALRFRWACHAVELAYVFGNLEETIYTGKKGNASLSKKVRTMWANFARTGDPSLPDLAWPTYEEENRKTMVLNRTPQVSEDILKDQRVLLSPLLSHWINPSYATMDYNVPHVRKMVGGAVVGIVAIASLLLRKKD